MINAMDVVEAMQVRLSRLEAVVNTLDDDLEATLLDRITNMQGEMESLHASMSDHIDHLQSRLKMIKSLVISLKDGLEATMVAIIVLKQVVPNLVSTSTTREELASPPPKLKALELMKFTGTHSFKEVENFLSYREQYFTQVKVVKKVSIYPIDDTKL